MRRIGVLTSGGDAPGMNAAIRASVRRGYAGLLAGELQPLTRAGVANVIQRGGTLLGTSRCEEFLTVDGRARAAGVLRGAGIEGLVAIGGDGTLYGATLLADEHHVAVAGVPGTIDNDVYGSDFTIGFDTAVNTGVRAGAHPAGGAPTARDRILASRLGAAAVAALIEGERAVMVGERCGQVVRVPLRETWEKQRAVAADLLALVRDLV
jgi:6-phosphofructokinase